jgi:hypothetical protein
VPLGEGDLAAWLGLEAGSSPGACRATCQACLCFKRMFPGMGAGQLAWSLPVTERGPQPGFSNHRILISGDSLILSQQFQMLCSP